MVEEAAKQKVDAEPGKGVPAIRAILGKKLGMTQVFDPTGIVHPVTVLEVGPCVVTKLCSVERDGYASVQLGYGELPEKKLSSPLRGQFKKSGLPYLKFLKEFRLKCAEGVQLGQKVFLEGMFQPGDYVDVAGRSKGKGFAGGVKRHGFAGGPKTHGQSDRHRAPGSLASRRSLGRVLPGQRMAGHMGAENVTVQKLEVIRVEPEKNLLYLEGAVPGTARGVVIVRETSKFPKRRVVHVAQAAAKAEKKAPKKAAPKKAPAEPGSGLKKD
ncbi:MAG: 50S ribosomal protein L3 [Elusimicrobia bacterium]|nr:50S ribosomal protein L3 [Elusimicrobiota bacterium]